METSLLRGTRGFTLVELVIVLAMMATLVTMAAPRFQQSPSNQVLSVARMLSAHLENARAHALGNRMLTKIVFDESGGTYTAYVDYDRNDAIALTEAEITAFPEFGARELGTMVRFGRGNASALPGDGLSGAVTLTDDVLELNVQGLPEPWGTMGTVYLVHRDDPNAVSAISIASSGSFKSWKWSGGSWQ